MHRDSFPKPFNRLLFRYKEMHVTLGNLSLEELHRPLGVAEGSNFLSGGTPLLDVVFTVQVGLHFMT